MNVDKIHPSFLEKIKLKPIISKEIEERIGKSTLDQLILAREFKIKTIISFKMILIEKNSLRIIKIWKLYQLLK